MSLDVTEVLAFELLLLFTSLELAAGLVEEAGAVWSTLLVLLGVVLLLLGMVLELEAAGGCADVASGVVLEVEDELGAGC